ALRCRCQIFHTQFEAAVAFVRRESIHHIEALAGFDASIAKAEGDGRPRVAVVAQLEADVRAVIARRPNLDDLEVATEKGGLGVGLTEGCEAEDQLDELAVDAIEWDRGIDIDDGDEI